MSGFLYFTEEATKPVALEDVQAWGLDYAFEQRPASSELKGRTPSGGNGWLFGDQNRLGDAPFGYKPESQKWRKIPGSEIWLGYSTALPPTPESLARNEQLAGDYLKMADGNEWLVPQLRLWAGERGFQTALPTRPDIDDEGKWIVGKPTEQAKQLDEVGERLYRGMVESELEDSEEKPLTTEQVLDDAALLLGINYVVSRVEVAVLGLLTNDTLLSRIARTAMDWETVETWLAKKNGTPTSDG